MDKVHFIAENLTEDQLVELIEYHNRRYWELGEPEIPDYRYDELLRALEKLNPDHPLLEAVQAPQVATLGKVHHLIPMLSLDKAYSLEDVVEWAQKYIRSPREKLLIQPKYDGISARYDGRILATRGDGEDGENISDKLPLIELEAPGYRGPLDRETRGEIVIRTDDFRTIYSRVRRKGGGFYKNPRNAAAGIMSLKEIDDVRAQGARLTLVDYNLISHEIAFADLREAWPELVEEMELLPYPLDGIVIKLADAAYAESLGNTAHHPRGAIAFKFTNIRRESRLLDVEWSFGKNCLTPVATLEPVEIGGTTIIHASLHNVQNILDMGLEIGDRVVVERAGDVIPHIVESTPGENRRSAIITHCPDPECNTELIRRGPELCCPNPNCFETRLRRLVAAVKSIGIENLGEPNIRRMMKNLGVKTLRDIFELNRGDILKLDGFAAKSADNLLKELAKARNVQDFQLLASLNIPHIGLNMAKLILTHCDFAALRTLNAEQLAEFRGVGPERAAALVRELRDQAEFLDELLAVVTVTHSAPDTGRPKICFTGKMPEKREFYRVLAESHGYAPVDDVTGELAVLVAADPAEKSSKLTKAAKHGIRIVALADFLEELKNAPPPTAPPAPEPPRPESAKPIPPEPPPQAADDNHQLTFGF